MIYRTKRLANVLALASIICAPWAAAFGAHAYAKTQPRTCKDRPDFIMQTGEPVTVRRCYAWGWRQVSETIRHG
jgi:hypothetical protein